MATTKQKRKEYKHTTIENDEITDKRRKGAEELQKRQRTMTKMA